jgi:hypothetical protein
MDRSDTILSIKYINILLSVRKGMGVKNIRDYPKVHAEYPKYIFK